MSSKKNSGKKNPRPKTPKELEDEKLIDEVLEEDEQVREEEEEEEEGGGEQYEEYDPNDVYDNEKESPQDVIDVNNLSQKQRARYERDNKRLFFLKALSLDPYQDIGKLAVKKCKLIDKGEGETMIQLMIGMIMETSKEKDFPARILNYFNKLVPDGYPNKITLDKDDVNELTNLAQVYEDKLMNQAKVTDPDKIFGEELNAETIKDAKEKKRITMMDTSQNFTMNPNQNPVDNGQSSSSSSLDYYINKYAIPDIGIMEMALNSIPNPRPNSIPHFITNFTDLYTDWMNNPLKILEQLKFFFGPTHGEHAFRIWRDYRENYQKKQGYSPMGMGGMNNNTMGMSMGTGEYQPYQGFNQYGFQPMQASPEVEAERMMDRRMDKLMKMLQFKMMNQAMENQTPLPMSGQGYEEIYDQNGKVIKRIMLPNGHGTNNMQAEQNMLNNMTALFKEMMAGKNAEMVEILRKVSQPDNMLTDFTKTIMSNFVTQQNPVAQIKEMLDITNMVKSQGPQDNAQKSIEAVKLDVDSRIAMQELELKKLEMQHNWRMDENQSREQDSNVDKWLNTLQGMGESIIKPVAIKFLEGFGKGQIPGGPLNGAFTQPTLQTPIGANEQDYAMQQQQYYQNMERERARPMAPMQPMMQQQQRQFNNQQQQPMQQMPPQQQPQQRTIAAASERDIETELQQLTPAQIQDIEDKMAIDDINREKVKNAIRAYKNGRRVSRPRPAEQVEEARNVLFNPPVPEELNEDDLEFDDQEDDEEDYEVPIARGDTKVPPATVQKPTKKFSDFEQKSTTEIAKTKKLNDQQKAMLSSGQMTDRELREIEDAIAGEDEDDEYSSSGVPMPAGLRNASEDIMVEENLKKTKQTPTNKKKEKKTTKEEVVEKVKEATEDEQKEAEKVLAQAEQVIVEEVPEDIFE